MRHLNKLRVKERKSADQLNKIINFSIVPGTYAQVCENVNGLDINRGSILSHLEVTGDSLTATISSKLCYN